MNRSATGPAFGNSTTAHISTQMVQLVMHYTGRGPTKARTTTGSGFVLVVLDDTLTRSERSLLAAGEEDLIRQQRRRLHELMRDEAVAIIERSMGRTVRAFMGDIAPDQGVAVAVFLLEPSEETAQMTSDGKQRRAR